MIYLFCFQIGETVLIITARRGNVECIDYLISNGANIAAKDNVCPFIYCLNNILT